MLETKVIDGMVNSNVKLYGKTVLITGANTGLGYETMVDLARRGARVIMACRDLSRAEQAKAKLLVEVDNAEIVIKQLDLASFESIRKCAKEINKTEKRLDILINNAGIMMCPQMETKDGFEMQMGINHIGHFLFTNLLLNLLKRSAPSRIVILTSDAHELASINWNDVMLERNYNPPRAYANSKLANIYHCVELSQKLQGTGVTVYTVHPGYIQTELQRHIQDYSHFSWFWAGIMKCFFRINRSKFIPPVKGAQTTIYCAIAPELNNISGKYYEFAFNPICIAPSYDVENFNFYPYKNELKNNILADLCTDYWLLAEKCLSEHCIENVKKQPHPKQQETKVTLRSCGSCLKVGLKLDSNDKKQNFYNVIN